MRLTLGIHNGMMIPIRSWHKRMKNVETHHHFSAVIIREERLNKKRSENFWGVLLHSHVFVITLDFTRHFYSFYQPWPLKIFNLVPHCFFVSSSEIRQNCEIFFCYFFPNKFFNFSNSVNCHSWWQAVRKKGSQFWFQKLSTFFIVFQVPIIVLK